MRRLALAALATACGSSRPAPIAAPPPASRPAVALAVPATGPDAARGFILHKFMQEIGAEIDTFTPTPEGIEVKATFAYRDRGSTVALAAKLVLATDGALRSYAVWGETSRASQIDERVDRRGDGAYDVLRDGKAARVEPVAGAIVASGYAPMAIQDLVLRTWVARGKPATLPLLTGGELTIRSRGTETYDQVTLEHVAIGGLVWGIEDAWLDDQHELAAVITRDAEFDHHEAVRPRYERLLPQLARAAGVDGVARLAEAATSARTVPHGPLAITGATLIDGTNRAPIADAVVVLDGDTIVAAGPRGAIAIPAGATTLDATGKFLVPGLWDMHAHVEQVEQGGVYLAAGVTTVRDMGNILDFITGIRDAIERGQGIGPRVLVDGLVDGEGPGSLGTLRITAPGDIAKVVDQLRALGCPEVKIYSSMAPALVAPIATYAHAHGMRVVGHVPDGMTSQQAVDAGYDSISHLNSLFDADDGPKDLSRDEALARRATLDLSRPAFATLIATLASHHTVIDDTTALFEQFSFAPDDLAKREPGLARLPRELAALFAPVSPKSAALASKAFAKNLELLALLRAHHIPVVAGTDITIPGHSLHRELELYVLAGYTPLEALQAATSVPARFMHRDDLGTIEAGKRADVVVLAADPLADIHNIRRIDRVVARGVIYDPRALWQLAGFGHD